MRKSTLFSTISLTRDARSRGTGAIIRIAAMVLAILGSLHVGPAWSRPPQPENSLLLTLADLIDPRILIIKLRRGRDPVSTLIRSSFSPRTRQLVNEYYETTVPDEALQQALVNDLNKLILGPSIYNEERFEKDELSGKTRTLIRQQPTGKELIRLNRQLLYETYPDELKKLSIEPLDIRADSLEYNSEKNLLIGSGHVTVRKDEESLRSDYAIINLETYDVYAEGNVFYEWGSHAWAGDQLRYNFKTQRGDFGQFSSFLDPFYVRAKSSQRVSKEKYMFHKAVITTCEGDSPLAYLTSRTLWMTPGSHVRGRHVVLHIGPFPLMYSPFWNQNIGDPNFISLVPGYNSDMSFFLLTAFNYRMSRHVEAATHLDYRIKRGPGIGQDILWSSSGNAKGLSTERYTEEEDEWHFGQITKPSEEIEEEDAWYGDLVTYYTRDQWPDEGEAQEYPLDNNRYRLHFFHTQNIDERNYFFSEFDYHSDPEIIEQFFQDEFDYRPEPENYLVLGHRGDKYTANLLLQKRLNDFYTLINRFPEASVDFARQEIGRSSFYYDGETSAGYLEKVWESNNTSDTDFSAFRFDSDHTIYYSKKLFRFLNVIPRAGYRGTRYSKTKEDYTEIIPTITIDSNEVPVLSSVTNELTRELSGKFRSVLELGAESSLKAFKVWETYPGTLINNLRHIAEPYVNYTYIPEPNVLPENLYQFDEIDEINEKNQIKIGMINKLQTKWKKTVYNLIYADIWTTYQFEPEENENDFTDIEFKVLSTLYDDWLTLRIDGEYNQYESLIEEFDTQITIIYNTLWKNELEHLYSRDSSNLLLDQLVISPFVNWSFSAYARYEFETQEMEAWGLAIQRSIECITAQLGVDEEDDDIQVWLQFWFTEFPKARIDVGM